MKENVIQDTRKTENDVQAEEVRTSQDDTHPKNVQASKHSISRLKLIQAVFETGLIITGLIAMRQLLPRQLFGDGALRYYALSDLLQKGIVSHISYSFVGPLFAVPLWELGYISHTHESWTLQFNLFIFSGSLFVLYWSLKDRIDRSLIRKFLLILIAASMFANHLMYFYGEVFTALSVSIGLLLAITRRSTFGWFAVILGVVNTPASILGLGLVTLKQMLESKRLRYMLVFLVALGLILSESWLRRGSPFKSGYEGDRGGFNNPFFFGLIAILFSFGKGIFYFAPGLLLPIKKTILSMWHEKRQEIYRVYVLWIYFLVGLILIYSSWWAWYGGWFWGPRFFLIASIPASFALAVRLHYRNVSLALNLLTAFVLCLSVWVGIDGAIYGSKDLVICITNGYKLETLCHYTIYYSVLWHPFFDQRLSFNHLLWWQELYAFYCLAVFAYLGFPLLVTLLEQTQTVLKNFAKAYLSVNWWRF